MGEWWHGKTGRSYIYDVVGLGYQFSDSPGNYIFAKAVHHGWKVIYVDQTADLRAGIPGESKDEAATRLGGHSQSLSPLRNRECPHWRGTGHYRQVSSAFEQVGLKGKVMSICRETHDWIGSEGTYRYAVYEHNFKAWKNVPSNYVFAKRVGFPVEHWEPLYFGATNDAKRRFSEHKADLHYMKYEEALLLGMTHIHFHANHSTLGRFPRGRRLNQTVHPPLNRT